MELDERIARQAARNRLILEALAAAGDGGAQPREVLHYAFPAEAGPVAGDDALRAAVAEHGFEVRFTASGEGLILAHEAAPGGPGFAALTEDLARTLDPLGWRYDGWESPVAGAE